MPKANSQPTDDSTGRFKERQAQIVMEAISILNKKGIASMMMSDVAAQLELAPTAVFYYYKNKEDLAAACMKSGLARFHTMIDAVESVEEPDRVRAFVNHYFAQLQLIAEGKAPALPLFNEIRALSDEAVNKEYVRMFKRLRGLVDASAPTKLGRLDRNIRTHQLLTQILWADTWVKRYEPGEFARLAKRFYDILANGYLKGEAPKGLPRAKPVNRVLNVEDAGTERILQTATQLINTRGYKSASIEKIAARLSLTKGAVYYHYASKEDLAKACFDRSVDLILNAKAVGDKDGQTASDRLIITLSLLMEHQLDKNVPIIRLSALASMPRELRIKVYNRFEKLTLGFASLISDGIADGSMRAIDPFVGASIMTGVLMAATEAQFWATDLTAKNVSKLYVRPVILGSLV
ncbi:MAG: TetR/AcrR family transcriptional regulator [Pseudomonadota bacterium]